MAAPIQSPAKSEVRSVIRFLNAKDECPAEIHKQIFAVYCNVMKRQNVTKWCREFSEGRTDVHDQQRNGRSPLISDDLLQETEGEIRANRRVTIRELHHTILEVSKTTFHEAVTEKLGYRKFVGTPHSAHVTTALLEKFKWDILDHPPYSPDLAPSDFHLFLHLKKHLVGKKFDDDDEAQEEVMMWFKGQAADFYDSGIQKLVPRLNKCLDNDGDCVEK